MVARMDAKEIVVKHVVVVVLISVLAVLPVAQDVEIRVWVDVLIRALLHAANRVDQRAHIHA